ncbi:unnamed protein product, partial [Acidithrix sp. C25]
VYERIPRQGMNLLTIRDTTLPKSKENGSHGRIASKRGNAS